MAVLEANQRGRDEIVSRRQLPTMRHSAYRVVARMIVVVRHGFIEDHASDQLDAVVVWFLGPAPKLIGKKKVGPSLAIEVVIIGIEHGESADQAEAQISAL